MDCIDVISTDHLFITTVVNQTCPSLRRGSLETTRPVPLTYSGFNAGPAASAKIKLASNFGLVSDSFIHSIQTQLTEREFYTFITY